MQCGNLLTYKPKLYFASFLSITNVLLNKSVNVQPDTVCTVWFN